MGIFKRFLGKGDEVEGADAQESDQSSNLYHKADTQAEILARERYPSTLDSVVSSVMIIDDFHRIMKLNNSCKKMMKEIEGEIRKDHPGVVIDDMLGKEVGLLYKDPEKQHELLNSLKEKETHHETVTMGSRTLDTIINPIFSPDKRRLGSVIEWTDVTEKLEREKEDRERLEGEIEKNAAFTRLNAALDVAATNIMVADEKNNIIYGNNSVIKLLKDAEPDIKQALPNFNADQLIGSNIDIFHKNPSHQRNILANLKSEYKTNIQVGSHNYFLVINPVFDEKGTRVGTVVEWKDLAEENKFEQVVDAAIKSAIDGKLDTRIDQTGMEGIVHKVSESINQLLDVFENVIKDTEASISALASGNLTRKIDKQYAGSYGKLKDDVNNTINKLVDVVTEIRESAYSVKQGSAEISMGNSNLSQRTEEQATSLEETAASMEEITTTVQQNAANALQANTLARGARETAENGGQVVSKAVTAMEAISESSNKITEIISVIDEIAFQTNLLALNAAVEAARAGDQGRGFAVVADEVRSLAGRSATAAKEIKDLIRDSGEKVREGSELVNKSGETLHEIVTAVKKVNDIVAEISTASEEQASGLDEVNKAVASMDDMTQQNAALVEEAAAASESLGEQAEKLDQLLSFFNTGKVFEAAKIPMKETVAVKDFGHASGRKPVEGISVRNKGVEIPDGKQERKVDLKSMLKENKTGAGETKAGGVQQEEKEVPEVLPKARKENYEDDKNWAEF